jgi:hypothetical protein
LLLDGFITTLLRQKDWMTESCFFERTGIALHTQNGHCLDLCDVTTRSHPLAFENSPLLFFVIFKVTPLLLLFLNPICA